MVTGPVVVGGGASGSDKCIGLFISDVELKKKGSVNTILAVVAIVKVAVA